MGGGIRAPDRDAAGSCVAICLWDPVLAVGGMNHFMLPHDRRERRASSVVALLCGDFAMEALLNGILGHGARRSRLRKRSAAARWSRR